MKILDENNHSSKEEMYSNRRNFLKRGIIAGTVTGIAGVGLVTSCSGEEGEKSEEISPPEDLMREHGLLNRILLIYDHCRSLLTNNDSFSPDMLNQSAMIIRNFIENYHEPLEENYLFPRFKKANRLTGLVDTLLAQHSAGRILTDKIIQLTDNTGSLEDSETQQLIKLLTDFNTMYRPHEAREDTVLFPALREIISTNEFYALGEDFEDKEHEMFGEDGFDSMVDKVAGIEKQLDIYELSKFTPNM